MDIDYTPEFKRAVKKLARRYRSIRKDINALIVALQSGEIQGEAISGSSYTLLKARFRNSDNQKGKSGGYRIVYYLNEGDHILLLTIYSKSDQESINSSELERIITKYEQAYVKLKN